MLDLVRAGLPPGHRLVPPCSVNYLYSLWVGPPSKNLGSRNFHLLYAGAARIGRSLELEQMILLLQAEVLKMASQWSPRHIFVHAGVVHWEGRTIVIPGQSFSGKSTLVHALVQAGAEYYSDEYAILTEEGRVIPYQTPIALRTPDGRRLIAESWKSPPERPVDAILVLQYDRDSSFEIQPCSPGNALLELMAHTLTARFQPALVLGILNRVAGGCPAWKGLRGEADATLPLLTRVLQEAS